MNINNINALKMIVEKSFDEMMKGFTNNKHGVDAVYRNVVLADPVEAGVCGAIIAQGPAA